MQIWVGGVENVLSFGYQTQGVVHKWLQAILDICTIKYEKVIFNSLYLGDNHMHVIMVPAWSIQYEECLQGCLNQGCQRGEKGQKMFFQLKKCSDDAEGRIDEHAGLRDHQE